MDFTYYAFATYVFLLICGGIWLFFKLRSGAKVKGGKSDYEKEQRLFVLYQNIEEMMSGFEEYAEEVKKDTDAALAKALGMLEEIRELSKEMKNLRESVGPNVPMAAPQSIEWAIPAPRAETRPVTVQPAPRAAYEPAPSTVYEPASAEEDSAPPLKTNEKIHLLNAQGFSATEIAKTLRISVREVTLALGMRRK